MQPASNRQRYIVTVTVPVVSERNVRDHFMQASKRHKQQKECTFAMLYNGRVPKALPMPIHVHCIRMHGLKMDDDNLSSAFKHVRDEVARWFSVDDGDRSKIHFTYAQNPGGRKSWFVLEIAGAT